MVSTTTHSNNQGDSILDNTLEYCIALYIEEGETRDGLLSKFSGNKIELVNWLRARAFKKGSLLRDVKPTKAPSDMGITSAEAPVAINTKAPAKKKKVSKTKNNANGNNNNNQNQFF